MGVYGSRQVANRGMTAETATQFRVPANSKGYSMDIVPIAVSINEACKWAGIGRSSIYQAIRRGELPIRKSGRRSLVLMADLQRWISELPTSEARHDR
jgi:excisionase family DNA binding protein